MRSLPGILFVSLMLLASCKGSLDRSDTFFDSLIVAQVRSLSLQNPSLTKIATLDGKEDRVTFHPDSSAWNNELDIYRRLSLFERPANQKTYKVEDGLKDEKSNLLVRRYLALGAIAVPEVKFYYYKHFENLKRIEAIYQQGNALYGTTRRLVMEFEEIRGKQMLSAYSLDGSEKMIFSNRVNFSIQSRINYFN